MIAYEPVWAIGTGKTATPEIAADAHRFIRAEVAKNRARRRRRHAHPLWRQRQARQRQPLIGQPEIDGALVGGASLKPDLFPAIVKY